MKKLALLALFGAMAAVSFGQATASASAGVVLTVSDYVAIAFDDADPFLISITDGGQTVGGYTSSNSKMLTIRSNKNYSVACPDATSGDLTFSAVYSAFAGTPGSDTKSVSAKVTGASLSTAPDTYNATLTFTVTQN